MLESKQGTIRYIYTRLKQAEPVTSIGILATMAIDASNQLYESDLMSIYELSHGFTKLILTNMTAVTDDIFDARHTLEVKRKLARILRSKSPKILPINAGGLVEIYIKRSHAKRGSWTAPSTVVNVDYHSGVVNIPGSNGKIVKAAFEDVRPVIDDDSFAKLLRDANDELYDNLHALLTNG